MQEEKKEKKEPELDTTLFYIDNAYDLMDSPPFQPGEFLEFKASVGWVKGRRPILG